MIRRLLTVILCLCPAFARGATYYAAQPTASPAGLVSNAGTIGAPWDVTKACTANVLNSGDMVLFNGGAYTAVSNFGSDPYDVYLAPDETGVTYKSESGEWAEFRASGSVSIMQCAGADSVTLDSLGFNGGQKGSLLLHSSDIRAWEVKNCVFDSSPHPSIVTVSDNESAFHMIVDAQHIYDWEIHDNTFTHRNGRGFIHIYGMSGARIHDNYFENDGGGEAGGSVFIKADDFVPNTDNEIYDNVFNGGQQMAVGAACACTVTNVRIHNNVFYGDVSEAFIMTSLVCATKIMTYMEDFFIYNNTFDCSNASFANAAIQSSQGWSTAGGSIAKCHKFYLFNNLFYLADDEDTYQVLNNNGYWSHEGGFIQLQFGDTWWSNYNFYVQTNLANDIYEWRDPGGIEFWNLAEIRSNLCAIDGTYECDSASTATTTTANLFTNPGANDYHLNPSYASYTTLATGGRGGAWPSYIGAFDPDEDICVSIVQNLPTHDDTLADYHVDLDMDFFDTDGDTLTVDLFGEAGDTSPDVEIADTVLIADDDWVWNWGTLVEDSNYYWQVIACDTAGCCDTSPIFHFTVDSVGAPIPGGDYGIDYGGIEIR